MKRLVFFILATAITISCSKNTAPVASFTITPLTGTTDTLFTLDASVSMDAESLENLLQFRWDWESDGLWDTKLSKESTIKHRFLADTTYEVTLQVVDQEGLTDSCKIEVLINSRNGTFIDIRDRHEYRWVRISCQTWMAENLAFLPSVSPSVFSSITGPAYYVYGYEGTDVDSARSSMNYRSYGVLYNWAAAMNGLSGSSSVPSGVQGVCPWGWHLPSINEYDLLMIPLVNDVFNMKSETGWVDNYNGDNAIGFNGLPAGVRIAGRPDVTNHFYGIGSTTWFWTATELDTNVSWMVRLYSSPPGAGNYPWQVQNAGLSVRCVKDN